MTSALPASFLAGTSLEPISTFSFNFLLPYSIYLSLEAGVAFQVSTLDETFDQ